MEFKKENFLQFLHESPTLYHATRNLAAIFDASGFRAVDPYGPMQFLEGDSFYSIFEDGAIIAGVVGKEKPSERGFSIVATHTDWPCFHVKPNPAMVSDGFIRLNTEPYGGIIWDSWMDRALGIAGRVILEGQTPKTKLFWLDEDLCTIPHIAMHIDAKANEGHIYTLQNEMLPVIGTASDDFSWEGYLAEKIGVSQEDLLEVDAYLVPREKSCLIGVSQDMVSAPHLDNLAMAYTGAAALAATKNPAATALFVSYNYEEIGSRADTGADSPMLLHFLERIAHAIGEDRDAFLRSLGNSFLLSADMAHAAHPAHPEKSDPTNRPKVNGGPVIKTAARRSYITSADTSAYIRQIAGDIPLQIYANRSEVRGGSTAGMHVQAQTAIKGVDMGCAVLGMHAFRELAGIQDLEWMTELFTKFYAQ